MKREPDAGMADPWSRKYERPAAERADAGWFRTDLSPLLQRVVSVASGVSVIVEAGSGTGRFVAALAERLGISVIGVDSSPSAVRLAGSVFRSVRCAHFVQADICRLPFVPASVDVIFADSTLEHLAAPRDALLEFARVVRPAGYLVLTVPNRLRPDGWDWYKRHRSLPYLQRSFTPWELRGLVEAHGFAVREWFGQGAVLTRNLPAALSRPAVSPREVALRRPLRALHRWLDSHLPAIAKIDLGVVAQRQGGPP